MVHKQLEHYRGIIEEAISRLDLPARPAGLYDPIRYAMSAGGKRLRPVLTLAVCEALGGKAAEAVDAALAVEMFHNFTLLHDDVMDNADLRRGRPTVHCRWNTNTAILSGDTMLTLASELLQRGAANDTALAAMNRVFNRTAIEVYEGQQYDIDFESRSDVTADEYIDMIRLKTSVLLGCACRMGAICAGANPTIADAFYDYGVKLGLAFQLRDDYLDTYGDVEFFGKEVGGDILNEKKTWLWVTAMSDPEAAPRMTRVLAMTDLTPEQKIDEIRRCYDMARLPERIRGLIAGYTASANEALAQTGLSDDRLLFFTALSQRLSERIV